MHISFSNSTCTAENNIPLSPPVNKFIKLLSSNKWKGGGHYLRDMTNKFYISQLDSYLLHTIFNKINKHAPNGNSSG